MATRKHLPDNFNTQLKGRAIEITDSDGKTIVITDLQWLANKLLNGVPCDRSDRAAAGAAIQHLLALKKAKVAP